ncbi:hypothetical protein GCM10011348_22130 [Marinobacterium nitratireducens]|uniref:AlpA family phage regulatory protein n=1 Tax=Marinobacterium nitratireducens TaxID=518897 RepID=A0A917ZFQ9_9GAMM|nr:AlpA family phage regulatory protein [Marinobacterium nitratireducens]GGO81946.1 hypothetical protein GCM10011348_22130 [Marinobacterium nitratireducens]
MHKSQILRPTHAANFISVSRATLYRIAKNDPTFPRKIRIGERCVGYRESDLSKWLEAREVAA